VTVSKESHHFLELYTNNYSFIEKLVSIKGNKAEKLFTVSLFRGKQRDQMEKNAHSKAIKNFDGQLNTDDRDQTPGDTTEEMAF
jgi:hypothetical protein